MSRYNGYGGGSSSSFGRSRNDGSLSTKVYVGDLPKDASEKEIERSFTYYGPIRSVWVARNPPGFAFVDFEDPRDAEDSVRALDGSTVCGVRVRVEMSNGKVRTKPWERRPARGMGRPNPYRSDYPYRGSRDRAGGRSGGRRSRSRSYDRHRAKSSSRSRSRSRSRRRSMSRSPRRQSRSSSPTRGRD